MGTHTKHLGENSPKFWKPGQRAPTCISALFSEIPLPVSLCEDCHFVQTRTSILQAGELHNDSNHQTERSETRRGAHVSTLSLNPCHKNMLFFWGFA